MDVLVAPLTNWTFKCGKMWAHVKYPRATTAAATAAAATAAAATAAAGGTDNFVTL